MKKLLTIIVFLFAVHTQAQVKIGNNPSTIDANSLLELESTNKGFLPPRVALNSTTSVAPLTGTIPSGMIVYSFGGTLADGFYYWNGTKWKLIATSELNTVTKTATVTLLKSETFVLASNDITLTLPVITSSDNGLSITVKNVGTHIDLISITATGAATIDDTDTSTLTRYCGQTYVATGGNWVIKGRVSKANNLLDVSATSSWTTLEEVVEFLDAHMTGPTVVRLGDETYDVSSTLVIDLDYPLTFQGLSYGNATIGPAAGLANKPMFRCVSDCYFKMLQFDATTLTNYGTLAGEDAIRFVGNATYNEVKDCTFDRFYNTILDSTDAEIWVFETDISNAQNNGILIHGSQDSVIVKVAETDFINCRRGINMSKGLKAILQLASGGYYNSLSTDTAIVYRPTSFTSFINISITGNSWNHAGKYIEGFDFTRSDGRDANAKVESNAGTGDKNPTCNINVRNSVSTTTVTTAGLWYKAAWTNTSSTTCKWTIANNRITYQPVSIRNAYFIISGNLAVTTTNKTVSIAIVKNGASGTRFGETTLLVPLASQPLQFSLNAYLVDILPGDYFEVYCTSSTNGDVVNFQDVLWLTIAQ